jgi:hypothetical protein
MSLVVLEVTVGCYDKVLSQVVVLEEVVLVEVVAVVAGGYSVP